MSTQQPHSSYSEIVTAQPEDLGPIVDLEEAISRQQYPNFKLEITEADIAAIGWGEARVAKYRERFLDNHAAGLWVAKPEGEVVGFVAASNTSKEAWVRKLYVAEAYRQRGLGSLLLRQAESWLGDSDIQVGVASYITDSLEFWRHHGYVVVGPRPIEETTVPATGTIIPELLLVKRAQQRGHLGR